MNLIILTKTSILISLLLATATIGMVTTTPLKAVNHHSQQNSSNEQSKNDAVAVGLRKLAQVFLFSISIPFFIFMLKQVKSFTN